MSPVGRPVHGVNLSKMTFESTLGLHGKPWKRLCSLARDIPNCEAYDQQEFSNGLQIEVVLTRCVGQLILLLLYAVLESFCISACDRDLLLY